MNREQQGRQSAVVTARSSANCMRAVKLYGRAQTTANIHVTADFIASSLTVEFLLAVAYSTNYTE